MANFHGHRRVTMVGGATQARHGESRCYASLGPTRARYFG